MTGLGTLFERRHRQTAESYDTEAFETHHAARLLAEARGFATATARRDIRCGRRSSVRVTTGVMGAERPRCAVWSGPETRTTLYIPTPPNMPLSLLVWIRGYADSRQRDQIRVRVDGRSGRRIISDMRR